VDIAVVSPDTVVIAPTRLTNASADDFALLVKPHIVRMGRLAERLTSAADRDDVLQEALIRAWLKRHTFDPRRGSVAAWLMAITADQSRQAIKRRRPIVGVEMPSSAFGHDPDLERALLTLPPRQRLAVDCYYFAGLSIAETAAVMRCSPGTVKSTLADARLKLRPLLSSDE
jgi:RNA polymerase sigma factor (sigma-70 family)